MANRSWIDNKSSKVYVEFDGPPGNSVLAPLKKAGFTYNPHKRQWSATAGENQIAAARAAAPMQQAPRSVKQQPVQRPVKQQPTHSSKGSARPPSKQPVQRPVKQQPKPTPLVQPSSPAPVARVQQAPQRVTDAVPAKAPAASQESVSQPKEGRGPNPEQEYIVEHVDGPMRVVAGPGTGKTTTIIARIKHLVIDLHVDPSEIMVVTYTVKAANELVSRIASAFAEEGKPVNLNSMRVGTFHSLCLDILREHALSSEMKNITVDDGYAEKYRIAREWSRFRELANNRLFFTRSGTACFGFNLAGAFANFYTTVAEEHVDLERLVERKEDEWLTALLKQQEGIDTEKDLADAVACYSERLSIAAKLMLDYQQNACPAGHLTFADIQARALDLLRNNPGVLQNLQSSIRYIIVDEYQDANNIQEEIVLALAGQAGNVCVVGDDDQSLYRFRGANVETILRFNDVFGPECEDRKLEVNYRSQEGIIEFFNDWMKTTDFSRAEDQKQAVAEKLSKSKPQNVGWGKARIDKTIKRNPDADHTKDNAIAVASCTGANEQDWQNKMVDLVRSIQASPDFVDLNQIAFICSSVRHPTIRRLINRFNAEEGLSAYAPRAGLFRERDEVRLAIGCLVVCAANAKHSVSTHQSAQRWKDYSYYDDCAAYAIKQFEAFPSLESWVSRTAACFENDRSPKEEGMLARLFCSMMQNAPFSNWIDASNGVSLSNTMQARNLSQLASLLEQYDAMMAAKNSTGWGNRLDWLLKGFFEDFFFNMEGEDLNEAEDSEEYAPSGSISFLTTHQAKGLEFPVVVACSLFDEPDTYAPSLDDIVRDMKALRQEQEGKRDQREKPEMRPLYDFWRRFYTAFSRAQDLLVLTAMTSAPGWKNEKHPDPSPYFKKAYNSVPDVSSVDMATLHLHKIKPSQIMRAYAFTSNMDAYEKCPRRYRLCKLLGFPEASTQHEMFGTLVHQTVEEIHKRAKGNPSFAYTKDDIRGIIASTRASIELQGGKFLKADSEKALAQVARYLENYPNIWRNVHEAEYDLSVVRMLPGSNRMGYILKGQVDLVVSDGGQFELLDFKTGRVPKPDSPYMVKYRKQLNIYAHLLQQRGYNVSNASLFFTGAKEGEQALLRFPVVPERVEEVLHEFDHVVERIEANDYAACATDTEECNNCLFKRYCGR